MFGHQYSYGVLLLLKRKLKSLATVTPFSIRTSSQQSQCAANRSWYCQISRPVKDKSFAVSYLIENCGFSPERAAAAAKRVHFENSRKPDSCFTFFRSYGFSDPQICTIFRRVTHVLLYDPQNSIMPKLQFFESKGLSRSDIIYIISYAPSFLERSLEKFIFPSFDLLMDLCRYDEKKALKFVKTRAHVVFTTQFWRNVQFLIDNGFTKSNVVLLLQLSPNLLSITSIKLKKAMDQVTQLGFKTSKTKFILALVSREGMSKSKWDRKAEIFKKWGWSAEMLLSTFKSNPQLMRISATKIDAVMDYWVNQLGWDSSILSKGSSVIGSSLERRIKPRASVLHYLMSKSLIDKKVGLIVPFVYNEKLFLQRYVVCYGEETPQLLKLYKGNVNIHINK